MATLNTSSTTTTSPSAATSSTSTTTTTPRTSTTTTTTSTRPTTSNVVSSNSMTTTTTTMVGGSVSTITSVVIVTASSSSSSSSSSSFSPSLSSSSSPSASASATDTASAGMQQQDPGALGTLNAFKIPLIVAGSIFGLAVIVMAIVCLVRVRSATKKKKKREVLNSVILFGKSASQEDLEKPNERKGDGAGADLDVTATNARSTSRRPGIRNSVAMAVRTIMRPTTPSQAPTYYSSVPNNSDTTLQRQQFYQQQRHKMNYYDANGQYKPVYSMNSIPDMQMQQQIQPQQMMMMQAQYAAMPYASGYPATVALSPQPSYPNSVAPPPGQRSTMGRSRATTPINRDNRRDSDNSSDRSRGSEDGPLLISRYGDQRTFNRNATGNTVARGSSRNDTLAYQNRMNHQARVQQQQETRKNMKFLSNFTVASSTTGGDLMSAYQDDVPEDDDKPNSKNSKNDKNDTLGRRSVAPSITQSELNRVMYDPASAGKQQKKKIPAAAANAVLAAVQPGPPPPSTSRGASLARQTAAGGRVGGGASSATSPQLQVKSPPATTSPTPPRSTSTSVDARLAGSTTPKTTAAAAPAPPQTATLKKSSLKKPVPSMATTISVNSSASNILPQISSQPPSTVSSIKPRQPPPPLGPPPPPKKQQQQATQRPALPLPPTPDKEFSDDPAAGLKGKAFADQVRRQHMSIMTDGGKSFATTLSRGWRDDLEDDFDEFGENKYVGAYRRNVDE